MEKINKRGIMEQQVYDFIKDNDGAYVEQVAKGTTLSRAMVQGSIDFLLGEDSIKLFNVIGSAKIYKVVRR